MISNIFEAATNELRKYLAGKVLQLDFQDIEYSDLSQVDGNFLSHFKVYIKQAYYRRHPDLDRTALNDDLLKQYTESGTQKDVNLDNAQIMFLGQLERALYSSCMTPTRALGHFLARTAGQRAPEGIFEAFKQNLIAYKG